MESYPPPPSAPPLRSQTNGLGIAGFVVSLVGILTCGLTSPIGLILSLFALKREPRGLAIAGTVIGGLGTLVVVGLVVMVMGNPDVWNGVKTGFTLTKAHAAIEEARGEDGALPGEEEGNRLIEEFEDGWGNPLIYELDGDHYVIRSAGPDGKFGTADDISP